MPVEEALVPVDSPDAVESEEAVEAEVVVASDAVPVMLAVLVTGPHSETKEFCRLSSADLALASS